MSSKAPWLDAYKLMATYPQLTHLMSCLSWVREGGFAFVINAGVRGLMGFHLIMVVTSRNHLALYRTEYSNSIVSQQIQKRAVT